MNRFEELCETFGVMKQVKRERYPREINLSEEFLAALKKEYYDLKLSEDNEKPVRNRPEKFNKAIRFHINHLENTSAVELEAMRQRYASEVEESSGQRVPEVRVTGEKRVLPQNDAPENTPPKDEKLCKYKRLVLKKNVTTTESNKTKETPDEVEARLKKKQGASYKTQDQRLKDARDLHGIWKNLPKGAQKELLKKSYP